MADERRKDEEDQHGGPGPSRKVVIAILIAITGTVFVVATWRSDVALQDRGGALLLADFQARQRQAAIDEIQTSLNDSRTTLLRLRVNARRARALRAQARAPGISADTRLRALALADGYAAQAKVSRERLDQDVLENGGTPSAFRRAAALQTETEAARRDLDPRPEEAEGAEHDNRAENLRLIGVVALVAALLLTCAEVSRSRWHVPFTIGGVIVLAISAGLLVAVGFVT